MIECAECWTDEDAADHAPECPVRVHVNCDKECKALQRPVTIAETRAALEHWKNHGWLSGCSHGH